MTTPLPLAEMTIDQIAEAIAATDNAVDALALMNKISEASGFKIISNVLIVDPNVYADDGNAEVSFQPGTEPLAAAEAYVESGDWGDGGESINVRVYQKTLDLNGEWGDIGEWFEVDVPENHESKILAVAGNADICGTDPDDHDWTSDGEGGCSQNPGVWSHGGTSVSCSTHCRQCGLRRTILYRGSAKNPGESNESTTYSMVDDQE